MKRGYWSKIINNLKESFRYSKNLGFAFALQVAELVAVVLTFILMARNLLIPKYAQLSQHREALEKIRTDPQALSPAELQHLKQIFETIGMYVAITIIAIIIVYLITKGLVWLRVSGNRFSWKKIVQFCTMNIAITALIAGFAFLLMLILRPVAFMIAVLIIILLLFHTLGVYNSALMNNNFKQSFRKLFRIGLKKIHYFLIPHAITLFALILLFVIMGLVNLNLGMQNGGVIESYLRMILSAIFLLIYLAYFVWQKNYIHITFKSLEKK